MKTLKKILFLAALIVLGQEVYLFPFTDGMSVKGMNYVCAKEDSIHYSYDSSGRLISAKYPDGTQITYQYDNAGNIKSSLLDEKKTEDKKTEEGEAQEEKTEKTETEGKKTEHTQHNKLKFHGTGFMRTNRMLLQGENSSTYDYTSFQKNRPVIKSLKTEKQKKKVYLKIQIKKIKWKELYSESGYQVKYSTKADFKKAKMVMVVKQKKVSVTGKKWKVKGGETYYVKVRAYIKTGMGKYLYSKYSKTIKIDTK